MMLVWIVIMRLVPCVDGNEVRMQHYCEKENSVQKNYVARCNA